MMVSILFQNDDIIAVDKPSGLACISERDIRIGNLHGQLSAMYPHKIYVVHRLDKEASGVVLFAKNADAHRYLCRQFAEHSVEKSYLALVHGCASGDTGRRHQLRVHFYSIGHTIVDDALYDERNPPINWGAKYLRLMLHAGKITFTISTSKQMTIESSPPEAFTQVIKSLRKFI